MEKPQLTIFRRSISNIILEWVIFPVPIFAILIIISHSIVFSAIASVFLNILRIIYHKKKIEFFLDHIEVRWVFRKKFLSYCYNEIEVRFTRGIASYGGSITGVKTLKSKTIDICAFRNTHEERMKIMKLAIKHQIRTSFRSDAEKKMFYKMKTRKWNKKDD